jgi:formyl-CoA transferase
MASTSADERGGPLHGVRVLELGSFIAGPFSGQLLGDYGADVIKIERKGSGDLSRTTFEPIAGHDNPVFCSLNRNKRSAAFDLKNPEHLAAVRAYRNTWLIQHLAALRGALRE